MKTKLTNKQLMNELEIIKSELEIMRDELKLIRGESKTFKLEYRADLKRIDKLEDMHLELESKPTTKLDSKYKGQIIIKQVHKDSNDPKVITHSYTDATKLK